MSSVRRLCVAVFAMGWLVAAGAIAPACDFCQDHRGPTLTADFSKVSMVLYGSFAEPSGNTFEGATDFQIETVLKPHELIKGQKVVTLPRYVLATKSKFVVFIDVFNGRLDPVRGVETQKGSDIVKYLTGAFAIKDKSPQERLRYAFDFLNSPDIEVSLDAYREYAQADYLDYQQMAKKLPGDVIAGWLRDPKTPPYRYGLYASLLGHCGKAEHVKVLRELLDDPEKRRGSGLDGLLASHIMIQPKEGWNYLTNLLKDTQQEFLVRYAGLRTLRFLAEKRPDLIPEKDLVTGMSLFLDQPDMADFAVEHLRHWKRWEMTDTILSLFDKEGYDLMVVKRAIMRFALKSPEKKAAEFVQAQKRRDAEWVRETEDLLQFEPQITAPANAATKK